MHKKIENPNMRGENHVMLAEALDGLYKSLAQNGGHLDLVTNSDIIRNCEIYPVALEYYYQNAYGVYKDVTGIIAKIFDDLSSDTGNQKGNEQLLLLFEKLRKQPVVVRIILCVTDFSIWEHGKDFFLSIADGWKDIGADSRDYLFKNFCYQFLTILELWEKDDFSEQKISSCIRLVQTWLYVDSLLVESDSLS